MDDITTKLAQILEDEQSLAQLREMAQSLGLGGTQDSGTQAAQSGTAPTAQSGPNIAALASMLGALSGGGSGAPGVKPQALAALQNAYTGFNGSDDNSALLLALKPHLAGERQRKVDDAIRIMGLLKIYPALRESGVLSGLFGGESQ